MRNLMLLMSLPFILPACVNIKSSQTADGSPAIYDFGLTTSEASLENRVPINTITATDALNTNRIRYRLNYKDPTQVLSYSESRWSMPPARLFEQQLFSRINTKADSANRCLLNIQLEAFDHVFESAQQSRGIIQISVSLVDKRSHKMLASTMAQTSIPATSNDAKGGVSALKTASQQTVDQVIAWSNTQSNISCNP